ncbi:cell envelope integrity protein TolA [Noviherbaspirillum denitrificans]|uniref:Protein TolA n=1 Tax=Noviherbaspirillum denitrificans TaxID=1968433 RepID=A0A254TIP8_9BURK|nr:cell envelope integrity protein TolA [Noviherbaspirillum denitrificans]OWW22464.1 protein TolA [Noviherbaspirillum denitrificans]
MTASTPYIVPKEPGGGRALTLAALVHAALFVFLWIGIAWQSQTPVTIEAEVWDPVPREAAPLPEPPRVKEPEPEPKPVVKEAPKPKVEEPPVVKPDIALEKEKKRKEEEKKKRLEEERVAKEKKRLEEEKLAKLKEEESKKRLEKEKADKAKKEADDKKRREEADQKLMAKMREDEMKRMTGAVGTGGTGEAPKSQGGRADGDYVQRIAAKIRSNINYIVPEGLQGNPPVEYEVRLLPDGSVAGIRKLKSSGIPGFDEAVSRAIERSQPYPRDKSGNVPSTFIGIHRPKDQ